MLWYVKRLANLAPSFFLSLLPQPHQECHKARVTTTDAQFWTQIPRFNFYWLSLLSNLCSWFSDDEMWLVRKTFPCSLLSYPEEKHNLYDCVFSVCWIPWMKESNSIRLNFTIVSKLNNQIKWICDTNLLSPINKDATAKIFLTLPF